MAMAQRREALTVRDAYAMSFILVWSTGTLKTGLADCRQPMHSLLTITWAMLILVFLQELLSTEEKMVHKLELDREKNSVIHLTQAKADCEGIAFLHLYPIR